MPGTSAPNGPASKAHAVNDDGTEFLWLLSTLDTATEGDLAHTEAGADRALSGLTAVLRMTALLQAHRCGWSDVVIGDAVLAKLCGRLGSEFPAEQEAAYVLAIRRLARRRTRWLAVIRIPDALRQPVRPVNKVVEPTPAPVAEHHPHRRGYSPPEGDWMTTIDSLISHGSWENESERALLHALAERTAQGTPPEEEDAVWLRELWWRAELLAPLPQDGHQQ